jgi:hypothetical protein
MQDFYRRKIVLIQKHHVSIRGDQMDSRPPQSYFTENRRTFRNPAPAMV